MRTRIAPMTVEFLRALLPGLVLALAASTATAQFAPDDFHACTLDTFWTFVDPTGGGSVEMVDSYTGDARVALSVPGGSAHEIWGSTIDAPHILQALVDADLIATVKFTSGLAANGAQEGLLVRQSDSQWLRLEFYRSDAGELRGAVVGGPDTVFFDGAILAVAAPLFMRVVRAGDIWALAWSSDGVVWQGVGDPFTYGFHPTGLGIYAGTRGAVPPAHVVEVDWIQMESGLADDTARNTLTVGVVGGGQVSRDPDRENYDCGEVVTVTALDQPGWAFSGWTGAVSGMTNPIVVTMDGPVALTAHFTPAQVHTLATTVIGGGSVSLSPPGGTYNHGAVVTLTAVDGPGWTFSTWSGDLAGSANPQQLVMSGDRAVTAVFVPAHLHRLTTSGQPAGAGRVEVVPPGGVYNEGTTVTLNAIPNPGWVFRMWWGGLTAAVNPAQLQVNDDLSVTAIFITGPSYGLTTTSAAGGHVVCVPDQPSHPCGSRVALTAVPDPGFQFTGWTGDLSGSASPDTLLMDADKSVHATFALPPPVFVSDDFNRCDLGETWLAFDPVGDGGAAVMDGAYSGDAHAALSVMGGVAHEIWGGFIGATHILQPSLDIDFTVEAKFDSDLPSHFGQEGLLIKQDESRWIRAEFLRDDTGRLRASLDLGPATVTHDVLLPQAATPPLWMRVTRTGNSFVQYWSTDGSVWNAAGNPFAYTMVVSDVGVYAGNRGSAPPPHTVLVDYFSNTAGAPALEDAGKAALTTSVIGAGTVTRLLGLPGYACGQVEQLTAVPLEGWEFVGWSGDATGLDNPLSLTMTGPRSVTASFEAVTAVWPDPTGVAAETRLYPCVPNPFNPRAVITFDLARPGPVNVDIYTVDGRLARVLAAEPREAGRHEVAWDGRDREGRRLGSGVYVVRLTTADGMQTGRMVMLR